MPELIGMSNRIIVMCGGRITGEVEDSEATQEKIMAFATKFDINKTENNSKQEVKS
jgi:methyl-galactoside transport system ATP-binding protein